MGECLDAFDLDVDVTAFGLDFAVENGTEGLSLMLKNSYPCPCSLFQAQGDSGRFQQQKNLTHCFVSTLPMKVDLFLTTLNLTQQCCFDLNTG